MNRATLNLYRKIRTEYTHRAGFMLRNSRVPAATALRMARDIQECEDRGLLFVWFTDDEFDRGEFPDDASVLNRCEFEHGGRHVESRDDCGNAGGAGHYPGELSSRCSFFVDYDVSFCTVVDPCERHEDDEYNDPFRCRDCKVLAALHGIEESRDNRERDTYRLDVQSGLASEALHDIHAQESHEMDSARAIASRYTARL